MSDTPNSPSAERNVGKIIARNVLFGFGQQFGLRVTNFIFSVVVIRALGDNAFGQYSIVLAWASLFSVVGDLGISQYLTREIARDGEKATIWFWDVVILRLVLAVVASVLIVSSAIVFGYKAEIVLGLVLFTLTYFFQAFLQPLNSILVGNERVDVVSVLTVVGQIIFIIFGGLFLFAGFNFVALIVAGFINLPVLIGLSLWTTRRNGFRLPKFGINPRLWFMLLRGGFPFAFTQLSLSFAFDSDTIFLSQFQADEVVGWYATAYRLMLTLMVFIGPFNGAILPTFSREYTRNPDIVRIWYYRSVKVMVFFLLPIAVGTTLLSEPIIHLLYGAEFLPAALALSILIWYIPFHYFTAFSGNLATTMKRESNAARIFGLEGGLNVLLNFLLIPPFGLVGAAFATVLTDVAGAGLFYFLFRRIFGSGLELRRLIRMAVAATAMGSIVYLLRDANILISIPVGGLVYFCLIYILGTFNKAERALFTDFIWKKTRSLVPGT